MRNLDGYIGLDIEVRVGQVGQQRGNVVISRKEILEEEQNAKKSVTLATLEEGSVLTGTVKNLTRSRRVRRPWADYWTAPYHRHELGRRYQLQATSSTSAMRSRSCV